MTEKISGSAIAPGTITITQISGSFNETSNASYAQANTARTQANSAYGQANSGVTIAGNAYGQANNARNQANAAYGQANAAYGAANTRLSASGGTVSGDLIITGNLTVSGNSTTLNTEVLTVEDADVVLLSNVASTPALNAGIIVNRGTSTNTFLRWDEVTDKWGWSDDGSTTYKFTSALDAYAAANNRVLKSGDTMTGQLNVSSGGLLVTGNVGIGTTSPVNKLHLNDGKFVFTSNDGTYGQFQINAPSGGEATIVFGSTGSGQNGGGYTNSGVIGIGAYGHTRDTLVLGTGYNNGTFFLKNDKVGIGTSSPGRTFHTYVNSNDVARFEGSSYFIDIDGGGGQLSGSNGLSFRGTTSGNSHLYITSGGNLGIGTTNPVANLTISNAGASGLEFIHSGAVGGGPYIQAYNRSTSAYMHLTNYALSHTWYVSGTRAIDLASNGSVGIGSSTPGTYVEKLQIQSTAGAQASVMWVNPGQGSGQIGIAASGPNFKIYNTYADGLLANGKGIDIDQNGNIGIGTTTPTNFGGRNLAIHSQASNAYSSTLWVSGAYVMQALINEGGGVMSFGARSNHKFELCTNDTTRMTISNTGNVGIGVTNPAEKLDVSSDMGIIIRSSSHSGAYAIRVGFGAGGANSYNSTCFGVDAILNNTGANFLTAFGIRALRENTTGYYNCAFGSDAMRLNTSGVANMAAGHQALYYNTTGSYNTAIGLNALINNTTSLYNTALGASSLVSSAGGNGGYNTAVGYASLYSMSTPGGYYNNAVGFQAGYSITTGVGNDCFGMYSNFGLTTGSWNASLGYSAGYHNNPITTGVGNVILGAYAHPGASGDNYSIVMGYSATGKGSSTGFINPNGGGVYQGNNGANWLTTSDRRIKKNIINNNNGLSIIKQIQVRNFEYREESEITELPSTSGIKKPGTQLGVIAQELMEVLPECVTQESTGVYAVNPDNITWYLVNAVKELSAQVEQLKERLGE